MIKINEAKELLPDLRVFSVRYITETDEHLKHLLANSIESVQSVFFNNHVHPDYRLNKVDIGK